MKSFSHSSMPFALALIASAALVACGGSEPAAGDGPGVKPSILATSTVMLDDVPDEAIAAMPPDAVMVEEAPRKVIQAVAAAAANPSIQVTRTSTWATGYCARVDLTNTGTSPLTWRVTIPVPGTIKTVWSAVWSAAGGQ